MKKTAVYKWVTRFSEGRESLIDEERWGRSATSRIEENIAKVHQILCENRRLTVRSIAEQASIDRETIAKFLTKDLDMRKVCAKMVPNELTEEHCEGVLASKQITVLEHPPYSSALAPSNFFLFRR
jgi:predicted HTH transcriptional regulator